MRVDGEPIRKRAAGVQAALAVFCATAGAGIAAVLHSAIWSSPPAILGLFGYGIFAGRATRLWQGPGVPCLHDPPCWPGARRPATLNLIHPR